MGFDRTDDPKTLVVHDQEQEKYVAGTYCL